MRRFTVARFFYSTAMLIIALISAPTLAINFDRFEYDVYLGDQNSDGIDDVYLSAKDSIIPLHGTIIVPLAIQLSDNYLITSDPIGFYNDPVDVPDSLVNINSFSLVNNVAVYDYNGDG